MRNNKRVTIKHIAQVMDVSPATVSKALRGSKEISREVQGKIRDYARRIGYRPDLIARALSSRQSGMLGVLVPNMQENLFAKLTIGINEQARRRGFFPMLMLSENSLENERSSLELFFDLRVDGVILTPSANIASLDIYRPYEEMGLPIVYTGMNINAPQNDRLVVDVNIALEAAKDGANAVNLLIDTIQRRNRITQCRDAV